MLQVLSNESRKKIHESALEVLETVGVKVDSEKIRNLLLDAGAKNKEKNIITIPGKVVRQYCKTAPRKLELTNLKGETVTLEPGGQSVFWSGAAIHMVKGKNRREINSKDFIELVKTCNQMEYLHGIVSTSIKDYPPKSRDFVGFRIMAQYCQKHLRPCIFSSTGTEAIIEMSKVLKDGNCLKDNSFFSFGYTCVNPLHWNSTALESFEKTSGYKIPFMINAEPLVGGTSPVTLAGSLVIADAEALSGIVITQLLEPGRPCVYNLGFTNILDMQTAVALTGTAQNGLVGAAGAEMAQFHNLPSASWMCTDSSAVDSQSAYEKMITGLMHALSHVNIIWGIGQLESELTMSLEQVVVDNDIAGNILRAQKGISTDEDQLALDVIKEVGLSGQFISHPHTMEKFREEIIKLRVTNRKKREVWVTEGTKTTEEKAAEAVTNILKQPDKEYLTKHQLDELMKIEKKWLKKIQGL
jgi:trimethylamine--corrinoid protein Co-methyltransferase